MEASQPVDPQVALTVRLPDTDSCLILTPVFVPEFSVDGVTFALVSSGDALTISSPEGTFATLLLCYFARCPSYTRYA